MAGTVNLGQFNNNQVEFEMDYDDNMDVVSLRCRNDTDQKAFALLTRLKPDGTLDTVQYAITGAPHDTTIITPQQTPADRIRLTLGSRPGRYGGYTVQCNYPWQ